MKNREELITKMAVTLDAFAWVPVLNDELDTAYRMRLETRQDKSILQAIRVLAAIEANGAVVAPKEPTDYMMAAVDCGGDKRNWPSGRAWVSGWDVMLAASPFAEKP